VFSWRPSGRNKDPPASALSASDVRTEISNCGGSAQVPLRGFAGFMGGSRSERVPFDSDFCPCGPRGGVSRVFRKLFADQRLKAVFLRNIDHCNALRHGGSTRLSVTDNGPNIAVM